MEPEFETMGTIRGNLASVERYPFLARSKRIVPNINTQNEVLLEQLLSQYKPGVVVNAIGVTKQAMAGMDKIQPILVNAIFPNRLYELCHSKKIKLVHVSTDCVFSGEKGNYSEKDIPDPRDNYGMTKLLGEIDGDGALTIRVSMIGRELLTAFGLFEWLLANKGGTVKGYSRAIFSGFPTLHLACIIAEIIKNHTDLNGIYHISADPIDKYTLIQMINEKMDLKINIEKDPSINIDRSLDSSTFRTKTGFRPLTWERMVSEIAKDSLQYQGWRN
jgi:dTDP-4-dehydrorhamnose reductase